MHQMRQFQASRPFGRIFFTFHSVTPLHKRGTLLCIHPSHVFSAEPVLLDSGEFFRCLVPNFGHVQATYHDKYPGVKYLPHPTPPFPLEIKLEHSGHEGVCCSLIAPQSAYQSRAKVCRACQQAYPPHSLCYLHWLTLRLFPSITYFQR